MGLHKFLHTCPSDEVLLSLLGQGPPHLTPPTCRLATLAQVQPGPLRFAFRTALLLTHLLASVTARNFRAVFPYQGQNRPVLATFCYNCIVLCTHAGGQIDGLGLWLGWLHCPPHKGAHRSQPCTVTVAWGRGTYHLPWPQGARN